MYKKASETIVMGWFDYADVETATRLKVSIDRIGPRNAGRVAYVSRSVLALPVV